jgi:DNA-binding CsgD family transcriptional regulator
MISATSVSELLAVLYAAPLNEEQWEVFLTLLCHHTGSVNAHFFCGDSRLGVSLHASGGNIPQAKDLRGQYNSRYVLKDPFRTALIRKGRTGVYQDEELLPNEGLLKSEMYQKLVVHFGVRFATLVPLTVSVRRFEAISLWRSPDQGPMDAESVRLLELLIPHLQSALEIRHALGITHQRLAGAEAIANASSTAAFILNRRGYVVHRNAAASALLAEEGLLTIEDGALVAADGASRLELQAIITKTCTRSVAPSDTWQTNAIALSCPDGQRSLQLLATPLPIAPGVSSGAEVLLLVTNPGKQVSFPDGILTELYALTFSEVEIANGLLMGYSLHEIASLRHVSTGTVRNQLKTILSKTGTVRQSDLVRLLMSLPQLPPQAKKV